MNKKIAAIAAATVGVLALGSTGGAVAGSLITGKDIKDGTVAKKDLRPGVQKRLDHLQGPKGNQGNQGEPGPKGDPGPQGEMGRRGPSGVPGLYYSIAYYDVGDTNAGAIATAACHTRYDAAVGGGVQTLGLDGGQAAAVASSFPGRMDWSTNKPMQDRLDGWIVQFDADQPPLKVKVWVLCAESYPIPSAQTYTQSQG